MKNNKSLIIAICMCLISTTIIIYNIYLQKNVESIYNYTIRKNDDYEVLLIPNNFYETETLQAGKYYVSNAIDSYIINLKADVSVDKKVSMEYDYNITANLIGTVNDNNEDKEVWNRKFILKDNIHKKEDNITNVPINEQININYKYYNDLARSYEKQYGISIDSILKIKLNITYNIILNDNSNKAEDFIELEIPITDTISEVKENYEKVTNQKVISQENKQLERIIIYSINGIIFMVSTLVIALNIIKKVAIQKQANNWKQKCILKYYKDIIVQINSEPNLENLKIINISILEDLIDIAEQNQKNILYYKKTNNNETIFLVIIDDYVYIYRNTILEK